MAYWTIDFMTKADRHIHIMIGGKSGSTDTALTPSDTPCVIEEEGKENLFVPIKTQSGYVEVVTDDMSLIRSIIPTTGGTRHVTIYETASPTSYDTPIWKGYVQPKLLTFKMWRGKQKLQIPIECGLSALKYRKINLPSVTVISIKNILYTLLSEFSTARFQGATTLFSDDTETGLARAWLWKKLYKSVFDKDSTQYEVLEQLCIFFGWTARQYKDIVYFMANRNVDAPNTKIKSIPTTSLIDTIVSPIDYTWDEVSLTEAMFADTSCKIKLVEGCRIAKATSELVTFDEETDVDFEPISTAIDNGNISSTNMEYREEWTQGGHEFVRTDNSYWTSFGQTTPVTIGDFTVKGKNVEPILDKQGSTDVSEWKSKLRVWYTIDYVSDTYLVPGTLESPAYYTTDYRVDERYFGELVIASASAVAYSTNGTMVINVQVDHDNHHIGSPCFFVKIGNQWYNPTTGTWQNSQPSDYIKQGQEQKDGYSIPIPEAMSGVLSIIFVPDSHSIHVTGVPTISMYYDVASISVEFTAEQSETYNSQIRNVEYSASNGNGFEKEVSFDSLICTKDSLTAKSKNFLLDNDEEICEGLYDTPYDNAVRFIPLQRLCDQAAAEMSEIGSMYEIMARWRGGLVNDITPKTMVYVVPLNEWCYPVSVEYNLRDDKVRLRLVKREYSEGEQ